MIEVTLPADYSRKSDSLTITIDDGKDSNTYSIQLETKEWLIDKIMPKVNVYLGWVLLVVAFLSAIVGLPTFFIWGGIFVLQLITHIPLLSIDLALNELKFLVYLNQIVSFNLFSTKPLIGYGLSETQPLNQNFARLEYKSSNFFENLGGLSLFSIALPVILLTLKILLSPTKLCKTRCSTRMHELFSLALILNICARLFLR